jgi:hypothetical protein
MLAPNAMADIMKFRNVKPDKEPDPPSHGGSSEIEFISAFGRL